MIMSLHSWKVRSVSIVMDTKLSDPERPSGRSRTDAVHGSWLEVHENRARHVAAIVGLIAVHFDALQLEVRVIVVRA